MILVDVKKWKQNESDDGSKQIATGRYASVQAT